MRILVADEQSRVRFALRVLLGQQPGVDVVGEATDTEDLLAQAQMVHPDLVLVHWGLQSLVPTDLMQALRQTRDDLRIIVLSARPEARHAALAAGADAFVYKADPPEQLLAAIHSVSQQAYRRLNDVRRGVYRRTNHAGSPARSVERPRITAAGKACQDSETQRPGDPGP